eukprot:642262-Amphidinium_carterae.1
MCACRRQLDSEGELEGWVQWHQRRCRQALGLAACHHHDMMDSQVLKAVWKWTGHIMRSTCAIQALSSITALWIGGRISKTSNVGFDITASVVISGVGKLPYKSTL